MCNDAPSSGGNLLDRLILALAIAGLSDGCESFDLRCAEDAVLVYDMWLRRRLDIPSGGAHLRTPAAASS